MNRTLEIIAEKKRAKAAKRARRLGLLKAKTGSSSAIGTATSTLFWVISRALKTSPVYITRAVPHVPFDVLRHTECSCLLDFDWCLANRWCAKFTFQAPPPAPRSVKPRWHPSHWASRFPSPRRLSTGSVDSRRASSAESHPATSDHHPGCHEGEH